MSGTPRDYPGVPCGSDPSVVGAIGTATIDFNRADYFANAWLRSIAAGDPELGDTHICRAYLAQRAENGRMRGQMLEAIAILRSGTDYEKMHVVSILEDGLSAKSVPAGAVNHSTRRSEA